MTELKVYDLMTSMPRTVTPDLPLREVLEYLRDDCCRQLPVVDDSGRLVGIITDRDVRLAMNSPLVLHERWQDEALLEKADAASCMTPNPITIEPDVPAYRAAEMLSTYKFGALPVVRNGELVGIITITDFLEHFITTQKRFSTVIDGSTSSS